MIATWYTIQNSVSMVWDLKAGLNFRVLKLTSNIHPTIWANFILFDKSLLYCSLIVEAWPKKSHHLSLPLFFILWKPRLRWKQLKCSWSSWRLTAPPSVANAYQCQSVHREIMFYPLLKILRLQPECADQPETVSRRWDKNGVMLSEDARRRKGLQ